MIWQFNPFLLVPALSALLTASLAWFGWRRRPAPGASAFSLVMLSVTIWAFGNALELGAANLPTKTFWLKAEYIGILLLPASWLAFALQYTGRGGLLNRRILSLLAVEPLAMMLLLWTNDFHGLFFRELNVAVGEGIMFQWNNVRGPFFWGNVAYSYGLVLFGSLLLLLHLSRMREERGGHEMVVVVGVIFPWIANVLSNIYVMPFIPGVDLTPFALSLTGLAFAWGLFRLRLLDSRPEPDAAPADLSNWRFRLLEGILRGVFLAWLFALAGGIYNVTETYRAEAGKTENALAVAVTTVSIYVAFTVLLGLITILRRLSFRLRAGALLFALYALGVMGLFLSSLSGDGRIFLFAFVILAAILFDLRFSALAIVLSAAALVAIGALELSGVIVAPAGRQIPLAEAGAWVSATIVFLALGVAALVSVSFLLRALEKSLEDSRQILRREQRLSRILKTVTGINQLIVREQRAARLAQRACETLIEGGGYSFAWIGLLDAPGAVMRLAASAGEARDPDQFTLRFHQEERGPACAVEALRRRAPFHAGDAGSEPCSTCPLLPSYSKFVSVTLPLLRENKALGVLTVVHSTPAGVFDDEEIKILSEMADDLAYALENLRAAAQHNLLSEIAERLMTVRDEDALWLAIVDAAKQSLHAERVAIYDYDRSSDRLSCYRAGGLSSEYIAEINRRFREAPGSRIITDPRPIVINDVHTDPSVASMRPWMTREGFRAYAVFPFLAVKSVAGAFVAYRDSAVPFSEADISSGQTLVHIVSMALENVRLYSDMRAKAAELGRLYAAAQDMASNLSDPKGLLQIVIRHMTEALEATSGYISSINLKESTLRVLAEYWANPASERERKEDLFRVYPLDEYPSYRRAVLQGKVVTLQADDEDLSDAEREQFIQYGICSMMFVPVMGHGVLQGGVEIWESRRRREFTLAEIHLAQAMAGHAAAVIENAQLFDAERAQLRLSRTLEQVGALLTTELGLGEALERLFDLLAQVVACDSVSVQLLNADGTLKLASGRGFPDLERARQIVREIGDQGVKRRHWSQGRPLVIPDTHSDERWIVSPGAEYIRSWIGAPLMIKGRMIGVLNVDSRTVNTYDQAAANTVMAFANQAAVAIENARLFEKVLDHANELALAYDNTLAGWGRALEMRDELTEGHTRRVTELTLRLARAMGLSEEQIVHIHRGAILHDIGKMGIPDSILLKKSALTPEEETIMRRHPQFAYDMLYPIEFLRPALVIPLYHHEKWDGAGYPHGLKGKEIPLAARIFAVADVWDALTSDRPYRPAWSKKQARLHIQEESGKYFDPEIVKQFLLLEP